MTFRINSEMNPIAYLTCPTLCLPWWDSDIRKQQNVFWDLFFFRSIVFCHIKKMETNLEHYGIKLFIKINISLSVSLFLSISSLSRFSLSISHSLSPSLFNFLSFSLILSYPRHFFLTIFYLLQKKHYNWPTGSKVCEC